MKDLVNVKKEDSTTMLEYISKIQNVHRKIAKCGIIFSDECLAMFYLMGLPLEKYEGLLRSLEKEENKISESCITIRRKKNEKRRRYG